MKIAGKIAIAAGILAAITLIWYMVKKRKALVGLSDVPADQKGQRLELDPISWPMRLGSEGLEVLYVQAFLNLKDKQSLTLDGILGPKTYIPFQRYDWYDVSTPPFTPSVLIKQLSISGYNAKVKPLEGELKKYLDNQGIIL